MEARKVTDAAMPSKYGTFRIYGFESEDGGESVVALVMGDPASIDLPLVRIHSQCLTGEIFGSSRCDCGAQLELAFEKIGQEGCGILVYQFAEGRGIGLMNKLVAYELQDSGHDTVEANHQLGFEADLRTYALCAAVLRYFDIRKLRLMSNNPRKIEALKEDGIEEIERVPIEISPSDDSEGYLRTKKNKLGHLLSKV
jgi:3,4-dihydroxy 2-butanone 4-phosphate synthase/GTP cyclohydrolase II